MSIPLAGAMLCVSCDSVGNKNRCERCGSRAVYPLAKWFPAFDGKPPKDRTARELENVIAGKERHGR